MSQSDHASPDDRLSSGPDAKSGADSATTEKGLPSAASPRRKSRWMRRMGIVLGVAVVLLALLVVFAPTIASLPAVHKTAIAYVNGRLKGEVGIESLSLTWGGPTEIRGLRVDDSTRRRVVDAARVSIESGLWKLITSPMTFGEITIESPKVVVKQRGDGTITAADAFESRSAERHSNGAGSATGSKGDMKPPAIEGRVVIKDGSIRVEREGAGAYDTTGVNGAVALKSLNDINGKVELTLADGAKMVAEAAVRQDARPVQIAVRGVTVRIQTDRATKIGPIANLVGQSGLDGGATLDMEAKFEGGTLEGRLALGVTGLQSVQRAAANAAPVNADIKGTFRLEGAQIRADVALAGDAGTAGAKFSYRLADAPLKLDADRIAAAVMKGESLMMPDLTLDAQANIDIARLGRAAPELLNVREGVEITGGRMEITKLTIGGGARPSATGTIALRDVSGRRGDKPVRLDPISLSVESALEPGQGLAVRRLDLESSFAKASASGTARELRATMEADLDRLKGELGQIFDLGTFDVAGRLSFRGTGNAAGETVSLAGEGAIDRLVVGSGSSGIREERLSFLYDARVDQAAKTISIGKLNVGSKSLTTELSGTIEKYDGPCRLDLKGRYSASWEAITSILHQMSPATAPAVIVAGTSTSEFTITGAARQAGATPEFRGLSGGTDFGWSSATLYGVKTGPAKFSPALKDGQLTLPRTTIAAADGKVNLGAVLDFQAGDATLRMAGRTMLLDNVVITREMGTQLLGRINPVFQHISSIEGRIKLELRDIVAPLGETIKKRGAGQGRLDLTKVKMQPGGLAAELLSLGGMKADAAYPVEIGALEFVMKDGRIHYDNFSLAFPAEFDLKFRGSVGLDDTLDLVVSIPVRAALLSRLGVKGPVVEYARILTGARVEIPLVGTRENPRLDFSKVDVQALMKDAVLKVDPAQQIGELLKGLQGEEPTKPAEPRKKPGQERKRPGDEGNKKP